jgi:hypothetical protein
MVNAPISKVDDLQLPATLSDRPSGSRRPVGPVRLRPTVKCRFRCPDVMSEDRAQ